MYFQAVRTLRNRIAKLDLDIAAERSLKARQEEISDLNRDQLRIGMRADGSFLPPYSKASVEKFGKTPGAIKLFDRGYFYEGIKPEFDKESFNLKGTDEKTDWLQFGTGYGAHPEGFGESIIGLSDYSIGELAQDSLGQIQFELRKQL